MAGALTANRVRELLDYDAATGMFRWRETRGGVRVGSAAAPEPELQFSCCLWGDGDLDVFPTLVLEHPTGRPAFRITREQARELWALMMGGQA